MVASGLRSRSPLAFFLLGIASCGYSFTAGVGRLPPGAERVAVRPLENRTADAEAGALVAAALRSELARRRADGGPGAPALIEGEVEEVAAVPVTPGAGAWRLTIAVRARLVRDGRVLAEERVRRSEDYPGGVDPLETEGRRRIAMRRAAQAAAREFVERLERPDPTGEPAR